MHNNDKTINRLLFLGSFQKNALTDAAFAAMRRPDPGVQLTVFVAEPHVFGPRYTMEDIPAGITVLRGRPFPPATNEQERRTAQLLIDDGDASPDERNALLAAAYRRLFGDVIFDEVVDYSGFSPAAERLFSFGCAHPPRFTKVPLEKNRPSVSVIVPIYRVEQYLSKCLTSLAMQTQADIEILAVNDGSPDDCQRIVNRFAWRYPTRVRPLIKENGGLSDARNFAMARAEGRFIAFVDSDDYVAPNAMERLLGKAEQENADLVICDFFKVSKKWSGHPPRPNAPRYVFNPQSNTGQTTYGTSVFENHAILRYASSYAWNKLYRRDLLIDRGFRFPKQWFEDSALIYNVVISAQKIAALSECLYYYRIGRSGAITNSVDVRIFDIFRSCDSLISFAEGQGWLDELHDEIEYLCIMHLHARLSGLRKASQIKFVLQFNRDCFRYLDRLFPDWRKNKYYLEIKNQRILKNSFTSFHKCRENAASMERYFRIRHWIRDNPLFPVAKRTRDNLQNYWHRLKNPAKPSLTEKEKAAAQQKQDAEVKQLQRYALEIMDVIHAFCAENGIRYFLAEGSLLGAVRHHGFIPWDDDMDIAMPRADFERFLALWDKQEIGNCRLLYHTTYKKYFLPFAKIVLTRETGYFNNQPYLPTRFQGPFVDLFPIDECPAVITDQTVRELGDLRKNRDYLLYKIGYIRNRRKRRRLFVGGRLHSYAALHRQITAAAKAYIGRGEGYVSNFFSSYPVTREHFQKEWFAEEVLCPFDGREYYIPVGAKEILTVIYGDYMQLPPPDKRVCKHGFTVKDVGKQ